MRFWLLLVLGLLCASLRVQAQDFEFRVPKQGDDAALAAAISDLALRILPVYEDRESERYLANLSALQLASGNAEPAAQTRRFLRERRTSSGRHLRVARVLFHDIQMRARAAPQAYAQVYAQALREALAALNDREAHALGLLCAASATGARDTLLAAFDALGERQRLGLDEAMQLIWKYLAFEAYRRSSMLAPAVIAEDQQRRYRREEEFTLSVRKGVELRLRVVRPREDARRAALLEYTLDEGMDAAADSAAHGFVGVVAIARRGPGVRMPFRHDGEDLRAVIAWIVQQPWSDGRVGVLGQGYGGFAAWAALKHRPDALRAVATLDPMAPGIDFPAEGRVMRNAALRWALEREGAPAPRSEAEWAALDEKAFARGEAYRRLERLAHAPSEIFRTWLAHPSYDRWWQKAIPYDAEFATLDVPVLTLLGADGLRDSAALYYLREQLRANPNADHRLLLASRESRRRDAAAALDLRELRLQWFEQVLHGAARPDVLAERVNLRVAGAQAWRRGASLAALAPEALRLHLVAASGAGLHRLLAQDAAAPDAEPIEVEVELGATPAQPLRFLSEPFAQERELIGVPRGLLDLWINAADVDLRVAAWERRADGARVPLFEPYVFRASYARSRTQRSVLRAGVRQRVAFEIERLVAHRMAAGSRLELELGVNHAPGFQPNYGRAAEVSLQSRAKPPFKLKMRGYGGSYIELPQRP